MENITYANFEILYKQHHKELRSLAYTIARNDDAAKDIVQEVFTKLWKNREKVSFETQIKHYLFRAVSHTALNYLRFNKKMVMMSDTESFSNSMVAPISSDNVEFTELELRVQQAIDKLPPKCRTIYLLSRHEGLKYREIADALDLSVKTVENQMGIALEKLRDDLKPFLTPEFLTISLLIALAFYFLVF